MKAKPESAKSTSVAEEIGRLVPAMSAGAVDEKDLVARIIAAYVSNNPVSPAELLGLMHSVRDFIMGMGPARASGAPSIRLALGEAGEPAVPIAESVTPEYIICLEDGARCKILKRYLRSRFGMSPEQYRRRWNLPDSYPMVAPAISQARSLAAKKMQLGGAKAHRRGKRAARA